MSQPLTATHRIEFGYTVDTVPHKQHLYCEAAATTLSAPSGWDILDQAGGHIASLEDIVDHYWAVMDGLFDNTKTVIGATVLQQRSGSIWNPLAFYTTAFVLTVANPYVKAGQLTVTFRTQGFFKLKAQIMESVAVVGQHYTGTVPSGAIHDYVREFQHPNLSPKSPVEWVTNRSGHYSPASGEFVAATTDLNDKLRRRRGIA